MGWWIGAAGVRCLLVTAYAFIVPARTCGAEFAAGSIIRSINPAIRSCIPVLPERRPFPAARICDASSLNDLIDAGEKSGWNGKRERATWKPTSPWLRAKNSRGLHRPRSKQALPLGGRASRFRSSGRACKSRQASSPPLVNLNKVVDSGSNVLTDVRSCPFILARTTWGKARRLTHAQSSGRPLSARLRADSAVILCHFLGTRWVCSDMAAFVVGHALVIDGGQTVQ